MNDPEKQERYLARIKTNSHKIPYRERRTVVMRQQFACLRCGSEDTSLFEYHHIVPKGDGGSDTQENIIVLCTPCHRLHHEYMRTNAGYGKTEIKDWPKREWEVFVKEYTNIQEREQSERRRKNLEIAQPVYDVIKALLKKNGASVGVDDIVKEAEARRLDIVRLYIGLMTLEDEDLITPIQSTVYYKRTGRDFPMVIQLD